MGNSKTLEVSSVLVEWTQCGMNGQLPEWKITSRKNAGELVAVL